MMIQDRLQVPHRLLQRKRVVGAGPLRRPEPAELLHEGNEKWPTTGECEMQTSRTVSVFSVFTVLKSLH